MSYFYLLIRRGMTGGTARGVYKMLCSFENWADQPSQGCLNFNVIGITFGSICWSVEEASSQEQADARVRYINANSMDKDYEAFCISFEDAMRIEKGEEVVHESVGRVIPEIVDQILEAYQKKKEAGEELKSIEYITKEDFEKVIKGQIYIDLKKDQK